MIRHESVQKKTINWPFNYLVKCYKLSQTDNCTRRIQGAGSVLIDQREEHNMTA